MLAAIALAWIPHQAGRVALPAVPLVDPYTRGDPAAMERAGYVSFGPFAWDDEHDTLAVERALVVPDLRWVETAHFKLGCALRESKLPRERDARAKLAEELERLAAKLATTVQDAQAVDPKARTLDPWLRLHLFAQRLEELYADFCERLEIDTAGLGPFLGQRGKYTVLLLNTQASWGRYEKAFLGSDRGLRRRYHSMGSGSLFYGDAAELYAEEYRTDRALTAVLTHSVVQNLADGYRSFHHDLPAWFRDGLGLWFARRVDPRFMIYALADESDQGEDDWKWDERVRARVALRNYPAWEEQLDLIDVSHLLRTEHMFFWSRVDYLIRRGDAGRLLHRLKEPPRGTSIEERQHQAFQAVFGESPAQLESDWAAWVLATYPTR